MKSRTATFSRGWACGAKNCTYTSDLGQKIEFEKQEEKAPHTLSSKIAANVQDLTGKIYLRVTGGTATGDKRWRGASIISTRQYLYGRFGVWMRYAESSGINNAIWLLSRKVDGRPVCEIDINEGHWPDEIATNIHDWRDGHRDFPKYSYGSRMRLTGQQYTHAETRIDVPKNSSASTLSVSIKKDLRPKLRDINARIDGRDYSMESLFKIADAELWVSDKIRGITPLQRDFEAQGLRVRSFVGERTEGTLALELKFHGRKKIDAVHPMFDQSQSNSQRLGQPTKVSVYLDGVEVGSREINVGLASIEFGRQMHYYELNWSAEDLVFLVDGVVVRRENNTFCHQPMHLLLSTTVVDWAGGLPDDEASIATEIGAVEIEQGDR